VATEEQILEGKKMLVRIVSMLCGLVDRFDNGDGKLHEEPMEYRVGDAKKLESRTRTRTRRKV
jgi:hypothetical protein